MDTQGNLVVHMQNPLLGHIVSESGKKLQSLNYFHSCSDSVLRHASSDFRKMGQRIFVFIVGGATRSEVRG